jgi:hypothetical protein
MLFYDEVNFVKPVSTVFVFSGSFSVFKYLIGVMTRARRSDSEDPDASQAHPAQSLITCFLCGWFITGRSMFFGLLLFWFIHRCFACYCLSLITGLSMFFGQCFGLTTGSSFCIDWILFDRTKYFRIMSTVKV